MEILGGTTGNAIEINGAKISGGKGTVGGDAIYSDSVVNIKINNATLTGGESGGKQINVADGSTVEIINDKKDEPKPITVQKDGITVNAAAGVFPADTVINIEKIADKSTLKNVESVLKNIGTKSIAFNITATSNSTTVQPNGKVSVTFAVPKEYDMNKVALYYVSDKNVAQKLEITKDTANRTVTAELDHFSVYALTELAAKSPTTGNCANLAVMMVIMLSSIFGAYVCKKIY